MHNRSKFHEKRGFRLEQIRLKQAKGFGRTPSFRHDIGFRLEQIRLKQSKGFGKAPSFRHKMACGCCNICEKKRRFRLHTALFRATEPHQASHHATPDPSGGNAAVVRDKKVMRLSVLPDIRRTTFSIPYLCHTYLNKRECCQTYSNLDCHKSDGFLALTDNRKRSFTYYLMAMHQIGVN